MSAHAQADGLPRCRAPLLAALIAGQHDVVRPLITRGADPALADDEGLAAFVVPAPTDSVATQQPLLVDGVSPGPRSSQDGVTPLAREVRTVPTAEHIKEIAANLIKDNVKKVREEVV